MRFAALVIALLPCVLLGQTLEIVRREIQFHGYASQGFIHTDNNNWLTMNTEHIGSGQFTEFTLNASSQITDNFRVGAQGFDRRIGQLGKWHSSLDWAYADYRFSNWFGLRGGKVKTTLGLYNDTQDVDFLHTFALLPQSIYPIDLRDATIAHLGGDVYGTVALPRALGQFSYTAYVGHRSDGRYSGYPFLFQQWGIYYKTFGGLQYGGDLRWNTPLKGLLVGASRLDQDTNASGVVSAPLNPGIPAPTSEHSKSDWVNQFYGSYSWKCLHLDSEYRRYLRDQIVNNNTMESVLDIRGWYFAGSYRVTTRLELGSYYSRYTIASVLDDWAGSAGVTRLTDTSQPGNHVYDKVLTARIDFNRFWNLKIEGHFMNGYGVSAYPDGFYPIVNPQGFKPDTNALVLKTGLHF
jgi:hypothetical protein